MTGDDLLRTLQDLEGRPRGSVPRDQAVAGFQMFLGLAKGYPEDSRGRTLAEACARACLRHTGVGLEWNHHVTDWRAVPVEFLTLKTGPVWGLGREAAFQYRAPDSVPGLQFVVRYPPLGY